MEYSHSIVYYFLERAVCTLRLFGILYSTLRVWAYSTDIGGVVPSARELGHNMSSMDILTAGALTPYIKTNV